MQMRPRACVAMKLMISGVTFSAAQTRSPSFSRSSSSTMMIMRPSRMSAAASSMEAKGMVFSLKNRLWRAFAVAGYVTRNRPFWRTDSLPGSHTGEGAAAATKKRPAGETFGEFRRPDGLPASADVVVVVVDPDAATAR